MAGTVPVFDARTVRDALPMPRLIDACEQAFAAYSSGGAALPSVIHLDIAERRAEVHVKAGYLRGGSWWALKVASGFPGNPARGLPASDGLAQAFAELPLRRFTKSWPSVSIVIRVPGRGLRPQVGLPPG